MTQVEIPPTLIKEVQRVMDEHPIYSKLGLDSRSAYVKEALKDFVKCQGDCPKRVFREEADRILISIINNMRCPDGVASKTEHN